MLTNVNGINIGDVLIITNSRDVFKYKVANVFKGSGRVSVVCLNDGEYHTNIRIGEFERKEAINWKKRIQNANT